MATSIFQRIISAFHRSECDRFEEIISLAADDMASLAEMASLETHLRGCASCRQYRVVMLSSRDSLRSRPRKEVPVALSMRLVNAIAAEEARERSNASRGGGIGVPVWPRLTWAGGSVVAVACAAVLFGVIFTKHEPTSILTPGVKSQPIAVATLPIFKQPTASRSASQPLAKQAIVNIASARITTPGSENVDVLRRSATEIGQTHRLTEPLYQTRIKRDFSVGPNVGTEVASLPKPKSDDLEKLQMPVAKHRFPSESGTQEIASLPKRNEFAPATNPGVGSIAPSVTTSAKPVQVASASSVEPSGGITATSAVESNSPHSELASIMGRLARRSEMTGDSTITLASMTTRVDYSGTADIVESQVR